MTTRTRDHVIWFGLLAVGIVGLVAAIVIAVLAPDAVTRWAMTIAAATFAINLAMVGSTPP